MTAIPCPAHEAEAIPAAAPATRPAPAAPKSPPEPVKPWFFRRLARLRGAYSGSDFDFSQCLPMLPGHFEQMERALVGLTGVLDLLHVTHQTSEWAREGIPDADGLDAELTENLYEAAHALAEIAVERLASLGLYALTSPTPSTTNEETSV